MCFGQSIPESNIFTVKIDHATCNFEDSATRFRCSDDESCVSDYSECGTITQCGAGSPYLCEDGSCAATAEACACPPGSSRCANNNGWTHCVNPQYADSCLVPADCPVDASFRCPTGNQEFASLLPPLR